MTTDATEDDVQFRRRSRRTCWIAALLEGTAAAAFIGVFIGEGRWAGIAFGIGVVVALLLWPMTVKNRDFPLWRLAAFSSLVFSLGGYLWLLALEFSLNRPRSILSVFAGALELAAIGVLVFGIFAIPVATGIARLAVILGNPKLDPK
jgi:uncharacterized membrane protein YjjP (DUF1212 family)